MESAYQRNAKTGRKAAGEMKLKNYICTQRRTFEYRYRKGNFEDISANNTQTAKREKRNPQKVYAIPILGKGKEKNEIKKRNTLNNS